MKHLLDCDILKRKSLYNWLEKLKEISVLTDLVNIWWLGKFLLLELKSYGKSLNWNVGNVILGGAGGGYKLFLCWMQLNIRVKDEQIGYRHRPLVGIWPIAETLFFTNVKVLAFPSKIKPKCFFQTQPDDHMVWNSSRNANYQIRSSLRLIEGEGRQKVIQ